MVGLDEFGVEFVKIENANYGGSIFKFVGRMETFNKKKKKKNCSRDYFERLFFL